MKETHITKKKKKNEKEKRENLRRDINNGLGFCVVCHIHSTAMNEHIAINKEKEKHFVST